MSNGKRCPWSEKDELSRAYHDTRWCRPVHDDSELFAMLVLEAKSVGLSWSLILKREHAIRSACDGLDPDICAGYGEEAELRLLETPGLIHSRQKIHMIGNNARAFQKVQEEFGSFDQYICSFTGGEVIDDQVRAQEETPTVTELSTAISKDLKKRGFSFVGPVIINSYMEAIGIYNNHLVDCPFHG